MTNEEANTIRAGDGLIVKFGARPDTRVATAIDRNRLGDLLVCQWRERDKAWTRPRSIAAGAIERRSREFEHVGIPRCPHYRPR